MTSPSSWPNLFVVGAAKAGTTSLWRYLGQHPEIFMSRLKEPHFFSGYRPPIYPVVHDEAAYLRLFAAAATRLRGEASPSYLWSEAAATRIKRVSPDAKILIALRDPVERAHSLHAHVRRIGLERAGFAAAVAAELRSGSPPEGSEYVARSRYAADVARYRDLFGENVRVILFEELVADVGRELAGVFAFLGVDPGVATRIEPEAHNAHAEPSGRLAALALRSRRARVAARRLVPETLRGRIERRLLQNVPRPQPDAATDELLTEVFAPDVAELGRLLGRPLPWHRWASAAGEPEPRARALAGG